MLGAQDIVVNTKILALKKVMIQEGRWARNKVK